MKTTLTQADRTALKTVGEVARTAQLQRRHLLFWLAICLFAIGVMVLAFNARSLFADLPELEEETGGTGTAITVRVAVDEAGWAVVNGGKPTYKLLQPQAGFDEFKYKLIDKPKLFIDQVIVQVTFANPLPEQMKFQSFAIHGIDAASEKQIDEYTIEYTATGVGPEATYTIAAQLPPGSIEWPVWRRILGTITNLPLEVWLAITFMMPLITVAVLLTMFFPLIRALVIGHPKEPVTQPPDRLSPSMVGILVHGRVSAREIAATLLDLAQRGYIHIFNKGNGQFAFAKSRPWQGLRPYELLLLTQLFSRPGFKTTDQDIELSVGATLFSPQVARIYLAMYDAAAQVGYFKTNPAAIHQRYRAIGLFLFFFGLGAFASVLLLDIQPSYVLFFLAGMMTMALAIIVAADEVPLLTPAGERARRQWLGFRDYLASEETVGYIEGSQAYYERFLPYAVVLRCEAQWVNRFREHPFGLPRWYDSIDSAAAIEDFAHGLYKIVGSIAALFTSAKDPTVN